MNFTNRPDFRIRCTVCKDWKNIIVLRKASLSLHQCLNCGTVFLGGYSDGFVPGLYAYYDKYESFDREDVFDPIAGARCEDLLKWFSGFVAGREVLDVGCGLGQFIEVANRCGWKAEGLELSRGAVDFARHQGLAVRNLDFLSGEIEQNSYDLVTLFEVIEHVPNPAEFLQRAGEVVRPGGLVYLTTPNFASLDRFVAGKDWKIIHPEHLTYFTPHTLRALVKKTGCFNILHFRTRNLSVSNLRVLKRVLFSLSTPMEHDRDETKSHSDADREAHDFMRLIASSPLLGLTKRVVNTLLNWTGLGMNTVMLLRCLYQDVEQCEKTCHGPGAEQRMAR